jgi:hypothetical protein
LLLGGIVVTIFIRAIEATDKAQVIRQAIQESAEAMGLTRFEVDPREFTAIPRTPFAYWVSDRVRRMFVELPPFEGEGRTAKQGLATANDFRFVRLWTEVAADKLGSRWYPFAKGGRFSPYYADVHLVVNWEWDGAEIRTFCKPGETRGASRPQNTDFYFRPGLTWPLRTDGLSFRAQPAGVVFAHKGPAVFVDGDTAPRLLASSTFLNSRPFHTLLSLQLARTELAKSYEVGLIQRTPLPGLAPTDELVLADLAHRAWSLKRTLDTHVETSHAFWLPALLQVEGATLVDRAGAWRVRVASLEQKLNQIQSEVDDYCFELYGFHDDDRARIEQGFAGEEDDPSMEDDDDDEEDGVWEESADPRPLVAELVSWCVGVAFGRFDRELVTQPRPVEPDPFAPLPHFSPAMDSAPTWASEDDLFGVPEDGILTDDPGSARDLFRRVRQVFDHLSAVTPMGSQEFEDAGTILDARDGDLRRWMAQEYFGVHIKRYSVSRRKAPLYWQLSIPSRRYSVWLYYPRLTKDTLYRVLNEHVIPKLLHEEGRLDELVEAAGENPTARQRRAVADQETFVEELRHFREEAARVAPLWHPNLDDGVVINSAALWRLYPHCRPWQKECKSCWEQLVQGRYDWAHVAMHLWPERVVPKCAKDPSLAIAHRLRHFFESEDGADGDQVVVDRLVAERSSPAVKEALRKLLAAPMPRDFSKSQQLRS